MHHTESAEAWVVVVVERGLPVAVHLCPDMRAAQECELALRAGMNEHEDETGVFRLSQTGVGEEIVFPANR